MERRKCWGGSPAICFMGGGGKATRGCTSTAVLVPLQRTLSSVHTPVPQAAATTEEDASGCFIHTYPTTDVGRPGRYGKRSPEGHCVIRTTLYGHLRFVSSQQRINYVDCCQFGPGAATATCMTRTQRRTSSRMRLVSGATSGREVCVTDTRLERIVCSLHHLLSFF